MTEWIGLICCFSDAEKAVTLSGVSWALTSHSFDIKLLGSILVDIFLPTLGEMSLHTFFCDGPLMSS